jgi:hypothetical protein
MLRAFCGTEDTSPKSDLTKEKKIVPPKHQRTSCPWRKENSAIAIPGARGLNPCPKPKDLRLTRGDPYPCGSVLEPAVPFLNDDHRVWRGLHLVPAGTCMQKTQAIGQ